MKGKLSLLAFSMFLLSACNSGGGGGSSNNNATLQPSNSHFVASDAFAVINPEQPQVIDLQSYVSDSNAQLESVHLVRNNGVSQEQCAPANIAEGSLGININAVNNTLCEYQFAATSGSASSTATLRVFATAATNPNLVPLSQNIVYSMNTGPIEIDLSSELGTEWNVNYELSYITIHGEEGLLGSASIKSGTTDTIVFNLPDNQLPGWNRIYYTVTDRRSPSDVRVGEVNVAMSNLQNVPPRIGAPFYEYHVKASEFDLEFQTPGCNQYVGKASSATCEHFADFNQFQFQSAKYSTAYSNHVWHVELIPGQQYHGKQATISISSDHLVPWNVNVYNSQGSTFNTSNRIAIVRKTNVGTPRAEMTFTNVNGLWYRQNSAEPLVSHQSYTLDLSEFQGLNITDSDGWQISSVSSSTAAVNVADSNDVFNKSITLSAQTTGAHYVSYVVNDHFGGFSSGILKFNIEPNNNKDWASVTTVDRKTITEPLLYSQYTPIRSDVSDFFDAAKNATVGVFGPTAADNYCRAIGQELPTIDHFSDNIAQLSQWPTGRYYWAYTSDESELKIYDLANNRFVEEFISSIDTQLYTACIVRDEAITNLEISMADSSNVALQKIPKQLVAMATFSDGTTADISIAVDWASSRSAVAEVGAQGLITGKANGSTLIRASIDGTRSNTLSVTVTDLADAYIDVFDRGNGQLYTSSPSVAYLDSIGGSPITGIRTHTRELDGPIGDFYIFSQSEAATLCSTYNTNQLSGRTNWTLVDENLDLSTTFGNMTELRGWPGILPTWTSSDNEVAGYATVHLQRNFIVNNAGLSTPYYAVCTSAP